MMRKLFTRSFVGPVVRCERGAAAVEFVMIAPIMIILSVATFDLGMGFYRKMEVQNAADAGVTYASYRGYDATAVANAVTSATTYPVQASPRPVEFCGCPSSSGVVTVSCSTQCNGNIAPGTYVRTSAIADYTPIFSYPAISSPIRFQSTATVRLR